MNAFFLAAVIGLAAVAPAKRPVLKRDLSPVNDGRGHALTTYADVVEPALKAVVSVYSSKTVREEIQINPLLRQFFGGQLPEQTRKEEGLGSGVIVSPDGYILTNNHVVEGADQLTVALNDNRKFPAKLVGTDAKTDIAVIKIDTGNLPAATLADSDKLRPGDVVFAIGNPLAVGETVTMGIVSAKGRNNLSLLDNVQGYEDFIQTDAAINLGNSGGALIDAKGRLVGINSAIMSPNRGNIGIGFAIPVNLAANIMTSLIATGTVSRGYLGVNADVLASDVAEQLGLPRETKGVIITEVTPGSPADKAGLRESDVVIAVDGKPVSEWEDMRLRISEYPPNAHVPFAVLREGKPVSLTVVLGTLVEDELLPGVSVKPLTPEDRRKANIDPRIKGLIVTEVADDSEYSDRIATGMVILAINRTVVPDVATARRLIQKGRNLFWVYYQGQQSYVPLTVTAVIKNGG